MSIEKLSALLNQAENASTEEEARVFMEKAQALSTKWSIDLAVARMYVSEKEKRGTPEVRDIALNDGRWTFGGKLFIDLFLSIGRVNDVKFNVKYDNSGVVAYGFPEDIDASEAIYATVYFQMLRDVNNYIASGVYKEEKVRKYNKKTNEWEDKPIHGRAARMSFMQGFSDAIVRRLQAAKREAILSHDLEVEKNAKPVEMTTDVVLRNKELEVIDFYNAKSKARGTYKGAGTRISSSGGYTSGDAKGKDASLGLSKALPGGSRGITA